MTIKISSDNIQANTLAALGSSVPKISAITYPGDDTAADIAGGQTIGVIGTGFVAGANILINGAYVSVVNVVSSTLIQFTAPVLSAGTYTLYVINTDGGTAISIPGISYSGTPTWTTGAGSLASVYETSSISSNVAATGDATVTYSLFSGTLPTSSTLNANTGLISGTAPASSGATTYSFVIRATDGQKQDTDRSFSITINTDVVTWISPANNTTTGLFIDFGINLPVTLSANSATGRSITFSANSLPAGLSISGNTITGTPTTAQTVNSLITATSAVTNRTASQIFNWTVSVANDTYFKNTTALLSGDTFINTTDSSTNNFAVTPVAAPPATNLTPFQNSYSVGFGGENVFTVPSDASLTIGTASATIELWIYPLDISGYRRVVTATTGGFASGAFIMRFNNGTFLAGDSGGNTINSSTMPILNQWNHIAWVGTSGSTQALYINGVNVGTSTSYNLTTAIQWIGGYYTVGNTEYTLAYLSNVRIVKGTAVYTGAFTPPAAPLTAISGTSLLTCQSNYVKDNSTNNFAITNTGAAAISQRTPFETTPSVTLGSTSFNGSSQYMSAPANAAFAFGTGDFTIEAWVYVTNYASTCAVFDTRTSGNESTGVIFYITASGMLSIYNTAGLVTATTALAVNTWNHVAVTRNSSTVNFWLNGTSVGAGVVSTNFSQQNGFIGSAYTGSAKMMVGYLSNLRVVKGVAVYTANFTPSTIPLTAISGTSLLTLQSPVPNNNNTFLDSSPNTFAVTRANNATQGSFSPFGSNWSLYTNGTSSYAYLPYNAARSIGTGDFSIECWIYISKQPANYGRVWSHQSNYGISGSIGVELGFGTVDTLIQTLVDGNSQVYASATYDTTSTGGSGHVRQWIHVVSSRQNGYLRLFVNGILREANVNSTNINGTSTTSFGTNSSLGVDSTELHMSNFRMCIGSVPTLYSTTNTTSGTTIFTPPNTPLTTSSQGATGVQLLLFQNNYIKDNSTNNFAVTTVGNPVVSRFSPFTTTTGYVPSIHGGSMYFNGTNEYLSLAADSAFDFGTGNFTIEAWVYPVSNSLNYPTFLGSVTGWSAGASGHRFSNIGYANKFWFGLNGSGGVASGDPLMASTNTFNFNAWYHYSVTRSGNTFRMFVNGVLENTQTYTGAYNAGLGGLRSGWSVWDGVNGFFSGNVSNLRLIKGTALYTSAFTPSTTPLTAVTNTSLLLGGTNAGVVDNSMQGNYITAGDSKISSATVKYGTGSMFFDGTGDYFLLTNNPLNGKFGTGDFTVEYWDKHGTQGTCYMPQVGTLSSGSNSRTWRFGTFSNLGGLCFAVHNGTEYLDYFFGSTLYNDNVWRHFAIVRQSGVLKAFVDGIQVGSNTAFTLDLNNNNNISVGAELISPTYFTGYIDDLRISKGVARYTGNFTPPAQTFYTK